MVQLYPRLAKPLVVDALADTRVVLVTGARQVGKSTLTRSIVDEGYPALVITLDDQAARHAAQADPTGFIAAIEGPALIDEVQRAPDLIYAIKERVDRDRRPGQFLLTGSANLFASRKMREALTGRCETIRLWPLSQAEIHASSGNVVDALFAGSPPRVVGAPVGRGAFARVVAGGGYPEALLRAQGRRRDRWFANYIADTLKNDLRDITEALKLNEMPRLLRLLASQAANELVYRNIAAKLDINHETVKTYVSLLEAIYLVKTLPAWRPGIGTREVQAPKGYIVDSGLLAHLLAANEERIARDDQVTGKLLENFVAMEILRQAETAETDATVFHYRRGRDEVDLVLESRSGEIVAVEVKAAASIHSRDYAPIVSLREARGSRFRAGIVIYTGEQTLPISERIWAVPVSGLWS